MLDLVEEFSDGSFIALRGRRRRVLWPSYPDETTIDFTAPGTKNMAGKTRTWVLYEPSGTQITEITTKSGEEKIAAVRNRAEGIKR